MTDNQVVQRGIEAARVLESPLLNEIWDGIEKEATEALVSCSMKPDAKEDRDALIWHLKMVRKQKNAFIGMIEQGKFAQHKIDNNKQETRVQSMFRRVVDGVK